MITPSALQSAHPNLVETQRHGALWKIQKLHFNTMLYKQLLTHITATLYHGR
jgi:hypothetical protein